MNLSIPEGIIAGLIGPNGAGKTTTIRLVLGLIHPDEGELMVFGDRRGHRPAHQRIGAVLERPAFYPDLSVRANLRVLAMMTGESSALGRADELLERFGLLDSRDARAGTLSLGLGQRLALASALIGDPPLLVLDEATNGLDPDGIRLLRADLRALRAEGKTIMVSSHALDEVARLCDEVSVFDRGRVVATAAPAELEGPPRFRVEVARLDEAMAVLAASGFDVRESGDTLIVSGAKSGQEINRALMVRDIVAEGVSRESGLEGSYLRLTRDSDQ